MDYTFNTATAIRSDTVTNVFRDLKVAKSRINWNWLQIISR